MLTGDRRTVDVVAGPDGALVLRVDRHCMEVLFGVHPELRDEFDTTGEARRKELHQAPAPHALSRSGLLTRLRRGAVEFLLPW